jgi:trans-aconitate methyltransferase
MLILWLFPFLLSAELRTEWALPSLQRFPLQQEDKVLEIGCCNGNIAAYMSLSSGFVIGINPSVKINPAAPNTLFLDAVVDDLPFEEQFDAIVSFSELQNVLNQKDALLSIQNALKPSGRVLLVIPSTCPNNIGTLEEAVARSEKWKNFFPDFHSRQTYYTPEEYAELLLETDLALSSITTEPYIARYPDKKALESSLKPTAIDRLPQSLQEEFIADILALILINNPPQEDGSLAIPLIKMEVAASK